MLGDKLCCKTNHIRVLGVMIHSPRHEYQGQKKLI